MGLTEKQEALIQPYRDEWLSMAFSTEPADRPRAEAGIREWYQMNGMKSPKIEWRDSLVAMADKGESRVNGSVAHIKVPSWQHMWHRVWENVWSHVFMNSVESSPNFESVNYKNCFHGQHNAHWLSYYDFADKVLGDKSKVSEYGCRMEIAKSAGWWLPHEDICLVSERPCELHLNNIGKLHCDNGPAIKYPDGWELWFQNGVLVKK
jgi:hypothetical protein